MNVNHAATYAAMVDEELLALVPESDELTDEAREVLWTELRRRGLEQLAQLAYESRPRRAAPWSTPPPKLVPVAYFDNVFHANLAKTKLDSEDIQCFLADEHIVRMNLFYSFVVGRIQLMVRESDRETALEALRGEVEEPGQAPVYWVGARERSFRVGRLKQLSRILLLLMLMGLVITLLTLLTLSREP